MNATHLFLEYLKENGPQTYRQLLEMPFWGGVRSRIPELVKQGRVIRCEVINPLSGFKFKNVVRAYKVPDGVFTGKISTVSQKRASEKLERDGRKRHENELKKSSLETMRRERELEKARPKIEKAITLLKKYGYLIIKSDDMGTPV